MEDSNTSIWPVYGDPAVDEISQPRRPGLQPSNLPGPLPIARREVTPGLQEGIWPILTDNAYDASPHAALSPMSSQHGTPMACPQGTTLVPVVQFVPVVRHVPVAMSPSMSSMSPMAAPPGDFSQCGTVEPGQQIPPGRLAPTLPPRKLKGCTPLMPPGDFCMGEGSEAQPYWEAQNQEGDMGDTASGAAGSADGTPTAASSATRYWWGKEYPMQPTTAEQKPKKRLRNRQTRHSDEEKAAKTKANYSQEPFSVAIRKVSGQVWYSSEKVKRFNTIHELLQLCPQPLKLWPGDCATKHKLIFMDRQLEREEIVGDLLREQENEEELVLTLVVECTRVPKIKVKNKSLPKSTLSRLREVTSK